MPEFVFMLTANDVTVADAAARYEEIAATDLQHVGFKDVGLAPADMRALADRIKSDGRTLHLEVVSLSQADELRSARGAIDLGVDYLLGGTRPEAVGPMIAGTGITYCPFPGVVTGHPSVLAGSFESIASEAARMTGLPGVGGVDLLAYRHRREPAELMSRVVAAAAGPVVVAGSIDNRDRIEAVARSGAWGFTIGSAILGGSFPGHGGSLPGCIDRILRMAAHVS